jgi:hypothetical protein
MPMSMAAVLHRNEGLLRPRVNLQPDTNVALSHGMRLDVLHAQSIGFNPSVSDLSAGLAAT